MDVNLGEKCVLVVILGSIFDILNFFLNNRKVRNAKKNYYQTHLKSLFDNDFKKYF